VHCRWWPPQAHVELGAALAASTEAQRPTAVVAMNDRVAMGVYQAAADLRLRVPHHLSVVSFDNSELASWLSPGLTSIGLPYFEMGRRAVEVLLGATTNDTVVRVHMPLHQRESVAAPRGR
jgi:LacI family transcriptional regulator